MSTPINETLLIAFIAWFVAQTLKVVGGLIREKRLDMSFLSVVEACQALIRHW